MAKKKKKIDKTKMLGISKYKEFLLLIGCCREELQVQYVEELRKAPKPTYINSVEVPANLNTLTYGQLDDLSRTQDGIDPIAKCLQVVMGFELQEIYEMNIFDVFGFATFCKNEIERINKLFSSIKVKHTSDELSAGIEQLNFGTFGVIDWYARRMGITNQDEVYNVAWVRIYTCMKNDTAQTNYERRLNEQFRQKSNVRR